METRTEGRDGWVEISHEGVHVLAKGDASLRERLRSVLVAAGEESPADVLTDELTTGGVRRTPDFAIVDDTEARVLVRGDASVLLTSGDGSTREVVAPARGPWADEDIDPGVAEARLRPGGAAEPAPEVEPADEAQPAAEVEPADEAQPAPDVAAGPAPPGWAMPSVFSAPSEREQEEPDRPALSLVESPGADAAGAGPGEGPAGADAEEDEELPSFDFLFGNTSHHRSSLLAGLEDEDEAASIDSGPVAAAGGFQPREDPAGATLAPPGDDEEPAPEDLTEPENLAEPEERREPEEAAEDERASAAGSALPGGLPPMPGGLPPMPGSVSVGEPPSPEPGARAPQTDHPQFHDGHLVGRRVAAAADPQASGTPVPALPEPDEDGMISSVPWADSDPSDAAGRHPGGHGLPSLPDVEPVEDTGEIPSGPMVLAVRCASGHHNAPHATRCRVCGQDLPTQQPEQTPRPALGLLRLSTGDVVTLDRGVLIGRAPRAAAEASGARAPHLVRIASPDNEISRNHVEIVLDGWHVLVRDLGSTNGTTVALPGSSPVRVRPGDQQTIEPGTTITLADQVSMVFEVTG